MRTSLFVESFDPSITRKGAPRFIINNRYGSACPGDTGDTWNVRLARRSREHRNDLRTGRRAVDTVLNYPFHYFWFVAGAWVSLFVGFRVYHRYIGRLEAKKEAIRNEAETPESTGATTGRTSVAHADEE